MKEPMRPLHWAVAGTLLGLLNAAMMTSWVAGRPIGASTAFPYAGGVLAGLRDAAYMKLIAGPGSWELWFLLGALVGALVSSLVARDFRLRLVPGRWRKYKGSSAAGRVLWASAGACLLILGARLAGGCTSGHILSGFMQLSAGSVVFGFVALSAFLVTGRLFYGR